MRVIFFAMPGRLAGPALQALLDAGVTVAAVAVPAPPGAPPAAPAPALLHPSNTIPLSSPSVPLSPPRSPLAIAAGRGIPTLALRRIGAPAVRAAVAELAPDLVVVACWPWRIPPALLAVPRLGFLNLHPSPLPELRGPEPLFWALQEGRAQTAVTVHWMDEGLDTGEIASAAPLDLPAGAAWSEVEELAAAAGARLLAALAPRLAAGEIPRRPQGPGGSYRPAPSAIDFAVDPAWPAARAFRFMRGTAAWGLPYALAGTPLRLAAALSYEPAANLGSPFTVEGGTARVQMRPGALVATLA